MNPCDSAPIATAPYYREARVTVVGRQTAYRMRHCCARRIDKTGGRRKLLRTSTRWAERQRIVGAETSRIAKSLAASVSDAATQAVDSASVAALRAAGLQWRGRGAGPLAFSWGSKGDILSRERISPLSAAPHGVGKNRSLFGLLPLRAMRGKREDFSFEKPSLFPYFLLCRSNYSASCIAFAAATAFACASAEHCS